MKNIKKYFAIFLIALTFVACKSTDAGTSKDLQLNPRIVSGKLDNGMTYYVMNNQQPENRITLRLVVKAGSCMEEDDQKGVAHFIEHLAFNGTEHFEKNSIVDFFELIGMNFGADLNAYTTFEETVYKLEIPADNPEYLQKALLILKDWASAVTFEQSEINKERGVVNEEWRLRRGLSGRIRDAFIPFVLKDSIYEKRLPIGDMNIIQNIKRDRILDFYNKWYKPELMSVVVVGDAKSNDMVKAIVSTMKDIPASETKISSPVFNVPETTEKKVQIFRDKEQPYTMVQIMEPDVHYTEPATEADFKEGLKESIVSSVLSKRFSEISMSADAPWYQANIISGSYSHNTSSYGFVFIPKNDCFDASLKKVLDEYDRFLLFGATEEEVARVKDSFITSMEETAKNKSSIKSSSIADELVSYIITHSISMDEDYMLKVLKNLLSQITVDDVNSVARRMFGNRCSQFFVIAPENAKDIPSEKEILNIWSTYENPELSAKKDEVAITELMKKPDVKARILSKKSDSLLKTNEYELENGLKIITKKTDFDKDKIYINGVSKGGKALISDEDIPSANIANGYAVSSGINGYTFMQVQNFLENKYVNTSFSIRETFELFNGQTNMKDLEYLLQYVNLYFTNPQFTDEGWERNIKYYRLTAETFGTKPDDAFEEELWQSYYGKNIRYSPVNKEYLAKINREKAETIFRERFSNGADFTFVFTGSFDEKKLIDLCCYYLGTIPGDKEKIESSDSLPVNYPKGRIVKTIKRGLEEQATVLMSFTGELPLSEKLKDDWIDNNLLKQLTNEFEIKLREMIREELGGSYGVSAFASTKKSKDKREYEIIVYFGCEPSRTEELKNAVLQVADDLKTNFISSEDLQKLVESYKREKEVHQKNNEWWASNISGSKVLKNYPEEVIQDVTTIPFLLTVEKIKELANLYFTEDNLYVIYLKPEK